MSISSAIIENAQTIAKIISLSNEDVARKFGINKENNPKHPSFYDENWVISDFERGEEYFLYKVNGEAVGCVAFEQSNAEIGYLNRLSVLPSYRKKGIGKKLTEYVFKYGKSKGISEISIGIIAKHSVLKNWYKKLGFTENGIKEFPHLPFDVLFMKYKL
jgi:N-acetylglutamate synthase-like GNAT family acetyltransferase